MLSVLLPILGFVSAALAQTPDFDPFLSPVNQSTFTVGQILPISWTPTAPAGKINLTLIGGPSPSELQPIAYIACKYTSSPLFLPSAVPTTHQKID